MPENAGGPERRRPFTVPPGELDWRFSRASGPGGQHVNTSDTRVELRWDLAATDALPEALKERALSRLGPVVTVRASEHRSQWRNRETARERLEALVADALRPPARKRRPTRKSRAVNERRLEDKRRRSGVKRGRGRPPSD